MTVTIDQFINACDDLIIANEAVDVKSIMRSAITKLQNFIVMCRHVIFRVIKQIQSHMRFIVPKEVKMNIEKVTNQFISIYNKINSNSDFNILNNNIKSVQNSKEYHILFSDNEKVYGKNDFVDVDTRKVTSDIQLYDRDLEKFEKEITKMINHQPTNYDFKEINCSTIILSELIKTQTEFLKWKKSDITDNVTDIGNGGFSVTLDSPSF